MCGIAGIFNFRDQTVAEDVIKDMLAQIRYRGPDECGCYLDRHIGIGNVRLSIIDLASGQQPMFSDDHSLSIVYNGEVFNYLELREKLIQKGIRFQTHSDTEVILRFYEAYGEDCLQYFNGQFAFAIWDKNKEELFLARDRMGIRPLFFAHTEGAFIFGSEIKVILESGLVDREIDYKGLQQIFTFWTSVNSRTCFEGISELPPGHYATVKKGKVRIEKYWELTFPCDEEDLITDLDVASRELEDLLLDAVRIRLRADVQVAAYLSGGIDSSATTYMIKQVASDRLNTFSIGFTDQEYDETEYQNEVAEFLSTEHIGLSCTNDQIAAKFPDVVWHTEIPILRTAPVPMCLLSENVRKNNIKVVITGEGADEMLGGYNIFKEMYIRRFWAKYPNSKLRPLLLKKLYPYIPQLQNQGGNMLKFFFGYKLQETDSPYYSHLLRWNNTTKVASYLSEAAKSKTGNSSAIEELDPILPKDFNLYSELAKAQWLESRIFMSGYLLSSQGDRMAMANSVEGRYPFLDHRVVEYCARIHPDLKLKGLDEKFILKSMMQGKIPESVLKRPKQAYRAPIVRSFLGENPPEFVMKQLAEKQLDNVGIFDTKKVGNLLQKLKDSAGSEVDNMALAAILSTQILYEKFIMDPSKPKVDMSDCRIFR